MLIFCLAANPAACVARAVPVAHLDPQSCDAVAAMVGDAMQATEPRRRLKGWRCTFAWKNRRA